jgi:hypothetical protein
MKIIFQITALFILVSCGSYSFSGKSIPPEIKNSQLFLFDDNSGRYDLSLPDIINDKLIENIESYNYFEIENSSSADSKITGTVRSYSESIVSQSRDETADQMAVSISVEVSFYNNLAEDFIIKNRVINETEYYEASGGDTSRNEAFEKLMERLSENILLSLSSNW